MDLLVCGPDAVRERDGSERHDICLHERHSKRDRFISDGDGDGQQRRWKECGGDV